MGQEMEITFPEGKRVDAVYKGLVIKTDQPVYAGGDGSAPAPFDLFLASIGTCAGFYVVAFCQRRGIPVEKAAVVMRMDKDPLTRMIKKISIEIQLPPEFPEKYRKAIIKSVDSCAVTAHILNPPSFEVEAKIGK